MTVMSLSIIYTYRENLAMEDNTSINERRNTSRPNIAYRSERINQRCLKFENDTTYVPTNSIKCLIKRIEIWVHALICY